MSSSRLSEASPFLQDEILLELPDRDEAEYDVSRLATPFLSPELLHDFAADEEGELWIDSEAGEAPARLLTTFTAKTLPVRTTVYVTQAARQAAQVDVLFFAHGLDVCGPVLKDRPTTFVTERPFRLGELVEASGRPLVLVVPFLDGENLGPNKMAFGNRWHKVARPVNLNGVVAEALEKVPGLTGTAAAPAVRRLILAGHSRAFGVFDALARAHADPEMSNGALGRLSHVWALDSTYTSPIADWRSWIRSRSDFTVTVVYRHGKFRQKGSETPVPMTTGVHGARFKALAAKSDGRLSVLPVPAGKVGHCAIPGVYLPRLLESLSSATANEIADDEEIFADWESGEGDELELADEVYAEQQVAGEDEEPEYPYRELEATDDEDEEEMEWASESFEEEGEEEGGEEDEEVELYAFETDDEEEVLTDDEEEEVDLESYAEDEMPSAGVLASSGLTPAEMKAVLITSTLETGRAGGFFGLTGNFDGQGLSFGLVNWTIGTGSLQPLLREFAAEHPSRWRAAFGPHASSFLTLIARKGKAAQAEQLRFAIEEMNTSTVVKGKRKWSIREPWYTYFKNLSEDVAFQRIEVRHVRDLLDRARYFCELFKLTSERAYTFMFDAVSSHGKWWLTKEFKTGGQKRKRLLDERLAALEAKHGKGKVPEADVLLAIADVLGETSLKKWQKKVRDRKRWFVTGVHPRAKELAGLEPRADVPYTSKTVAPPAPKSAPAPKVATTPPPRPSKPAPAPSADAAKLIAKAIHQAKTGGKPKDVMAIAKELASKGWSVESWFADFVPDATFLGQKIRRSGGEVPGVHRRLLDVLQNAERQLLAKHPGRTAEELGKELGLYDIAGLRPPKAATGATAPSKHCFGLAIDINKIRNPFIGNQVPNKEKAGARYEEYMQNRSPRMIERAMSLLRGEAFNVELDIPSQPSMVGKAWDLHHRASETLAEYLRLAQDLEGEKLARLVVGANARGDSHSLAWWKKRIESDRALIKHWDFPNHPDPEKRGYMDLPRPLVVALVEAGLTWGGQFPGAASGRPKGHKDIMHFDLRPMPKRT